jgi:hypothetical protein
VVTLTGRKPVVVVGKDGRKRRRFYIDRGSGRAAPPDAGAIQAAVEGKARTTPDRPSQLDSEMDGVPAGGTIAVHMRGGKGSAEALRENVRQAMASARLSNAPAVHRVEFFLPDRTVIRYVRKRDGTYRRTLLRPPGG